MITGASYGTLRASRAQLQLRQILNAPEIKANVAQTNSYSHTPYKLLIAMVI